jgi:hypothetical protein
MSQEDILSENLSFESSSLISDILSTVPSNNPNNLIKEEEGLKNIEDILLNKLLALMIPNEKNKLFSFLNSIRIATHLYYDQWKDINEKIDDILDISFEILRKYEINGLQLNGLGCWFFSQVVRIGKCQINKSKKYSEEIILEVILRIFFEHPVATLCQGILIEALKQNPSAIFLICQIGNILSNL